MHERISAIVAESVEVKRRYFAEHAEDVVRVASMIAASFGAGGKVLLCGNGGSSTDAQHVFRVLREVAPLHLDALGDDG